MKKCKFCNKPAVVQGYFDEPMCWYHVDVSLEVQAAEQAAGWSTSP